MEKSSFFNSVSQDRTYKAEDWASYFSSFIGNGVFPIPSSGLQVVIDDGMTVTVKTGKAWINGYFYNNTSDLSVDLATADGVLNRIDRIVVRWDLTNRIISVAVKQSTFSAQPTASALQRDADIYELALADISVLAGTTDILQANITDRRWDTNLCGIVVGVVDQIDPSTITAQFDNFFELYRTQIVTAYSTYVSQLSSHENRAEQSVVDFEAWLDGYETSAQTDFEAWFDTVKDTLGEDVAGELAQGIIDLDSRVTDVENAIDGLSVLTAEAWLGASYCGSAYLSTIE